MIDLFRDNQPLLVSVGLTLTHFLWQGLALALVLAVMLRLMRGRSAQARYVACGLVLLGMVACVPATFLLVYGASGWTGTSTHVSSLVGSDRRVGSAHLAGQSPSHRSADSEVGFDDPEPAKQTAIRPVPATEPPSRLVDRAVPTALADRVGSGHLGGQSPPYKWWQDLEKRKQILAIGLSAATLLWAVGVIVLGLRLIGGWAVLRRWQREAEPVPDALADTMDRLMAALSLRKRPLIRVSDVCVQPLAFGLLRPIVLLPVAAVTELPADLLEAMIAHELAHIRRYDLWVNLLQRVAEILLFYHPAVWWVSGRMRLERELCCDDLAVRATGRRVEYAESLVALARRPDAAGAAALAVGMFGSRTTLAARIRRVLQLPAPPERTRAWLAGPVSVTILSALVIAAAIAPSISRARTVAVAGETPKPASQPAVTTDSTDADLVVEDGSLGGFAHYEAFLHALKTKMPDQIAEATPVVINYGILRFPETQITRPVQIVGIRLDEMDRIHGFKSGLFYEKYYPGMTHFGEQKIPGYGLDAERIALEKSLKGHVQLDAFHVDGPGRVILPEPLQSAWDKWWSTASPAEKQSVSQDQSAYGWVGTYKPIPLRENMLVDDLVPGWFDKAHPGVIFDVDSGRQPDGSVSRSCYRGEAVQITFVPVTPRGHMTDSLTKVFRYVDDTRIGISSISAPTVYLDFDLAQKLLGMDEQTISVEAGGGKLPARVTQVQIKLKPGIEASKAREAVKKVWESIAPDDKFPELVKRVEVWRWDQKHGGFVRKSPPSPTPVTGAFRLDFSNVPMEQAVRSLAEQAGQPILLLDSIDPKVRQRPLDVVIPHELSFDEALTTLDQVLFDRNYWIVREENGLVIRQVTEWYRNIPAQNWFLNEAQYRAARLHKWEVATVRYQPRHVEAQFSAQRAVDAVPINAVRAPICRDDAAFDLSGFVYFLDQDLELLTKEDASAEAATTSQPATRSFAIRAIQPGDWLNIRAMDFLERDKETDLSQTVDEGGDVYVPSIGKLQAAGSTPSRVRDQIIAMAKSKSIYREDSIPAVFVEFGRQTNSRSASAAVVGGGPVSPVPRTSAPSFAKKLNEEEASPWLSLEQQRKRPTGSGSGSAAHPEPGAEVAGRRVLDSDQLKARVELDSLVTVEAARLEALRTAMSHEGVRAAEKRIEQLKSFLPVYSMAAGVVAEVVVCDGQQVKRGELLIRLDDAEILLELQKAKIALQGPQDDLQFLSELRKKAVDTVPIMKLHAAEAAFRLAELEVKRLTLRLERTRITSPVDGILHEFKVGGLKQLVGRWVNAGDYLRYIVPDPMASATQPADGRRTVPGVERSVIFVTPSTSATQN